MDYLRDIHGGVEDSSINSANALVGAVGDKFRGIPVKCGGRGRGRGGVYVEKGCGGGTVYGR